MKASQQTTDHPRLSLNGCMAARNEPAMAFPHVGLNRPGFHFEGFGILKNLFKVKVQSFEL